MSDRNKKLREALDRLANLDDVLSAAMIERPRTMLEVHYMVQKISAILHARLDVERKVESLSILHDEAAGEIGECLCDRCCGDD